MIVLLFAAWNSFFRFRPMADFGKWWTLMDIFLLVLVIYLLPEIINNCRKEGISSTISLILIMFGLSVFWSNIFWDQDAFVSFMNLCSTMHGVYPLVIFVLLQKYHVPQKEVTKAIIILCIIYSICLFLGQLTFPNSLFGYYSKELNEISLSAYEERGVLRLNVPGADFVILCIFGVLSWNKKKKINYIILIPLFLILFLRGTRTPLFVALFVGLVYLVLQFKNKLISIALAVAFYLSLSATYELMLNSRGDSILVRYVQLTNEQIEKNNMIREDVRIGMIKYMFGEFNNDNVAAIILGNGIYAGESRYQKKMEYLQKTFQYHVVDSGFTNIFISFGILGLILYLTLLIKVILTKVSDECMFAKLYILYLYLIMPTNTGILTITPFTFALALYLVYKGSQKQYSISPDLFMRQKVTLKQY